MADQSPDQTRKHQHKGNDESIQECQKTDEQDEPANAVQAKTLTNIYYDCLERIFDFLDLRSLLNVAGTCKRLQIAAAAKFGDDSGVKSVLIDCCYCNNREPIFRAGQNSIYVRSLKFCFPFLRCFGAKISHLHINGHNDHVDAYINEYCADTLTSIAYNHKTQFPVQAFHKPFKLVESINLNKCRLLPSYVDWFQNIKRLSIYGCSIEVTPTAIHFPYLEHLSVHIRSTISGTNLALEDFKNLSQSNQQLQTIEFYTDSQLNFSALLDMLTGNGSISQLVVFHSGTSKDVTMVDLNRFATEHPSVVQLLFHGYRFATDDAISFIQKLGTLKSLRFNVNDQSEYDRLVDRLDKEWQHQFIVYDDGSMIELDRK